MKCIHCDVNARLPGGGVYCRICTLAGRTRQREVTERLPWWEHSGYRDLNWRSYFTELVAGLQNTDCPVALPSDSSRAPAAWFPKAAIKVLADLILGSS